MFPSFHKQQTSSRRDALKPTRESVVMCKTLALTATLLLAACATATATAPLEPAPGEASFSGAAVREDLSALYIGLQNGHFDLYAHTSKQDYDRLYAETRESIRGPMTAFEAHVLLQRFTAAGRVAHASLGFPGASFEAFREGGGRVFPIAVRVEGDRLYVARNLSGDARMVPGAEILEIDGAPSAQWLARLRLHVSADTQDLAMAQIEPAFAQFLWLEIGEAGTFHVAIRAQEGGETVVRLASRTRAEMTAALETAPPGIELNFTQRVAHTLSEGVAYLRPGIFLNLDSDDMFDTTSFHAFIDTAFEDFMAAGADTLLIDLRDNPGGDNSFSDHMIAWFADQPFHFASQFRIRVSPQAIASNEARLDSAEADSISRQLADLYAGASIGDRVDFSIPLVAPRDGSRFAGRVFVLVNRRSFSNCVLVAAIVQDYSFGSVLGEPTSDLATTYGAAEQFTLPNTALSVSFPKAFMVRPSGDARVQGVIPDIAIETPIVALADDPVLREALNVISAPPR